MKPAPAAIPVVLRHGAALLLLALALIAVYSQVGGHGYIDWDDTSYVAENTMVREGLSLDGAAWAFSTLHMSNWHPLTWLSHMLDVTLFGLEPGPQHLVNALLHGINSALVYAFLFLYLRRTDAAFLAAMLFLVHPQHVESVAWIAERKDLLCALFYLLALIAYRRWTLAPGPANYLLLVLAFALALLSKPMAVSLPAVLLILDLWPLGRLDHRGARSFAHALWPRLREKIPLILMSAAACAVAVLAQQQAGAITALEQLSPAARLANAAVACVLYLRDFLLPTRLAVVYPILDLDPWREVLPCALLLLLLSVTALASLRKGRPAPLAGLLWFLVTLLPVIGLVQVGMQARADRYMYLPSIGLVLLLGAWLPTRPQMRRASLFVVGPLLLFYAGLCYLQLGYWEHRTTLFQRTVELTGDNFFAEVCLSDGMLEMGLPLEAAQHAARALLLHPDSYLAHQSMGNARLASGDNSGAQRHYRRALALAPAQEGVLNNLAVTLIRDGHIREAQLLFREAVRINPYSALTRKNLDRLSCPDNPAAACTVRGRE